MQEYDYIIVGAGLYGCTIARLLKDAGYNVKVIDKRPHIGGNCASQNVKGIDVHLYGPHVLHTSNQKVWDFVQKYAEFYPFRALQLSIYENNIYNIPVNKKTIQDIMQYQHISSPEKAKEMAIDMFFKPYSEKMWGCDYKDVPQNALKRIPSRDNYDMYYHHDKYSGVPEDGWNSFFENLLYGIDVELNTTYKKGYVGNTKVIYTGPIDRYFDSCLGVLEWRSLDFEFEIHEVKDYQGNSVIHYPEKKYDFNRVTEFKHFLPFSPCYKNEFSVICRETPIGHGDPIYPVETEKNLTLLKKYQELALNEHNVYFAGRLGSYKYTNMDTTIENAFKDMEKYV